MSKQEQEISLNEAKSALAALAKIDQDANKLVRPPMWLTVFMALLYGMVTFSWALTEHDNLWMLGLIISTALFLLSVAFYVYRSRLLGVKPKLVPKSKSEYVFHILTGALFAAVLILSRELTINGYAWAAYVGSAINALALGYTLRKYSTGEFIKGAGNNE